MSLLSNILITKKGLDPVTMPTNANVSDCTAVGLYPVGQKLPCATKWRIIMKTLFNIASCTCKARIAFYDSSQNLVGFSDELDIQNTGQQEGAWYHGTLYVVANELSASYYQVRVTSAPTNGGSAKFFFGTT